MGACCASKLSRRAERIQVRRDFDLLSVEERAKVAKDLVVQISRQRIEFEFRKTDVPNSGRQVVRDVAKAMAALPEVSLLVQGRSSYMEVNHLDVDLTAEDQTEELVGVADEDGTSESPQACERRKQEYEDRERLVQLSHDRATSVKRALQDAGVQNEINCVGFGAQDRESVAHVKIVVVPVKGSSATNPPEMGSPVERSLNNVTKEPMQTDDATQFEPDSGVATKIAEPEQLSFAQRLKKAVDAGSLVAVPPEAVTCMASCSEQHPAKSRERVMERVCERVADTNSDKFSAVRMRFDSGKQIPIETSEQHDVVVEHCLDATSGLQADAVYLCSPKKGELVRCCSPEKGGESINHEKSEVRNSLSEDPFMLKSPRTDKKNEQVLLLNGEDTDNDQSYGLIDLDDDAPESLAILFHPRMMSSDTNGSDLPSTAPSRGLFCCSEAPAVKACPGYNGQLWL